ncbi:NDR1/HIN1-like protein 10 [Lycium barbarum]|uniref:NDR1/HIN1-like protein 10 n=1 Tax=Lycium barbarum TaxID=112863 RepID=UPI00293E937A|nr:NDR1/HIN1-like protein 10 [Lycium barbarum]
MPEQHLNGAYYGPSIPPPSKSYHRRGSSCNPCSCLFGCLCKIILTIIIILGVIALVVWLVLRPNKVKFYVTDATLTQFDLSTTNNTLYYDFALNMTVRNPNKRIGIYYDSIEARAMYQGERFASQNLEPFYQGHKNTSTLSPVFKGQSLVLLGDREKSNYNNEKNSGIYEMEVKLYMRIRLKAGRIKTHKIKPKIECDFKVPLDSSGRSSTNFESKRCHLDW